MEVVFHKDLSACNTFRMKVSCAAFAEYASVQELRALLADASLPRPLLHIGGGSNLLFTGDFPGTVLHSAIRGMEFSGTEVRVGAGEPFDGFCAEAASRGLWGPENLSLIPGETGAAAVQNIGAYGVEVKDIIDRVEAFDTVEGKEVVLTPEQCRYRYRDSLFKHEEKGRYIVTAVRFRLHRDYCPQLSYGHVKEAMTAAYGDVRLTPEQVRAEIIRIRREKLPAVEELGSAGSFFRNPFVSRERYEALAREYGRVPHYDNPDGTVKVPAAWLIEQCGLKGYREGNVAVYARQPLVIVNATGEAAPDEVIALEERIVAAVREKFSIGLQKEVEYI